MDAKFYSGIKGGKKFKNWEKFFIQKYVFLRDTIQRVC